MVFFRLVMGVSVGVGILLGTSCAPEIVAPPEVAKAEDPFQRGGEFGRVTSVLGPLKIRAGEYEGESRTKPWSSWWFPLRDRYLFEGSEKRLSPLEKYDLFVSLSRGKEMKSAAFERDNIYDPRAIGWEGLCDAWAAASLMEKEPRRPVMLNGVEFGVGDLKALVVKSYENLEGLRQFGQRFNGDRVGLFDDIHAEQFHRLVQYQLFERAQPFIMDKDPGPSVWNIPVWRGTSEIVADPSDPGVMHVTTWLVGASPFVESYDFVGTLSVGFEYTYDLKGKLQPDGLFHVESGEWTGESLDFHPDFLTILPEEKVRHSRNPQIDSAIVDEILMKAVE